MKLGMSMKLQRAPEISAGGWLKGDPVNLAGLRGKYVLLHFFQVNCPGCFSSSIPMTEYLHEKFSGKDFEVIGIATRFEEFDVNTKEATKDFLGSGKLTQHVLDALRGRAPDIVDSEGKYKLKVTHRVAWDRESKDAPSKTFADYSAQGTPFEVLINRDGLVVAADFHLSQSALLNSLLAEVTGKKA